MLVIEGLQLVDRHVLDVALRADRQVAVRVKEICRAEHALERDDERTVLILLELVADDGHLLIEILTRDEAVRHAVRFEIDRPSEVRVRGRKGLEIIRPIEGGRGIERRAVRGNLV